ncbi:hypothetical protein CPB86DRAFT_875460 [Serendipita vermifera]|nr:hypothetical protein CPB86DRAFT_875460 [Serendipita vermifera]
MESLPPGGNIPESPVTHELVSEREAEIELLEEIMWDMDYKADDDIQRYQERADRYAKSRRCQKPRPMTPRQYTLFRMTQLLEERDQISQEIYSLRQANRVARAFAIGLRKTPDEILSLIFREYVEMDLSVWFLIDVCPHWKHVAFATPHLWSAIKIEPYFGYGRPESTELRRSNSRAQLCYTEFEFKRLLDMSGRVALDVGVHNSSWHRDIQEMMKCLKLLNTTTVISRVKSLEVGVESRNVIEVWPQCFLTTSFHRLEHLIVTSDVPKGWQVNLIKAISTTSTCLRTLKVHLEANDVLLPEHVWSKIKVLQLMPTFLSRDMDRMVQNFSHVEELTCLHFGWPEARSPITIFPNLIHASFSCFPSGIRALALPAVQTLHVAEPIGARPFAYNDTLDLVTFPEVQSMEIESSSPELCLTNISMPKLASLRLHFRRQWARSNTFQWASIGRFSTLKTLILHFDEGIDDAFAVEILQDLPSLTSFASSSSYFRDYGAKILPCLMEYDEGFLHCPILEELTLGMEKRRIWGRKTVLVPLMKRLIKARERYDAPLLKAEIYWDSSLEAVQYV